MKRITGALLVGAALGFAAPAAAEVGSPQKQAEAAAPRNSVSVTAGVDYSAGDYGAGSDTKILIAPLSISDRFDNFRFTASMPYLRIDGPAGVVLGPDGRPLPGATTDTGKRSGFGDLTLGATATLPEDRLAGFSLDLTGRVKLPTSKKSKHLGTGKTDFSVEADLSRPMGNWAPFVTVGYRMPGDPTDTELKNTFSASVGTSVVIDSIVAIAAYDYSEASSPLADDAHDLFGAVSGPLSSRVKWTLYGIGGLSDGSPDYEAGLLFTYKLN